jgi:hypothetical protein
MDFFNFDGLLTGIVTFLIIGIYHPIVIKCEYYLTKKCWWIFLVLGFVGVVVSLYMKSIFLSTIFGVFAFTNFWAIGEVIEQEKRVQKGWFPKNPKRK